ncbi:DUF6660 family protein [Chryseobacterium camelliae]|uniref:DUF6660 family protein n=1 Tax=Chryseobacterium camelliae TaxID=1265445 RepID=UPI0028599650|nr:DUF6660 family protein [Chryseobacterium camelliae]MDR6514270.1 hypothetical protein [Chryseobacterium camelliae]
MNLIRLLLTIYFAVLTVLPCNDLNAQPYPGTSATMMSYSENSHSKDRGDICSPLCICNCCQITADVFRQESVLHVPAQVKTYFSRKILFRKNDFAYLVYDQIWQPPKI